MSIPTIYYITSKEKDRDGRIKMKKSGQKFPQEIYMKVTLLKKEKDALTELKQELSKKYKLLFKNGKYRGALNRAYYSMFYAALALLALKN